MPPRCWALAAGEAHAETRLLLSPSTTESDLHLPVHSQQKVVVTAYEENDRGLVRPRTVAVWGRGRWDDNAAHGRADLRIPPGGFVEDTDLVATR